MSSQYFPDTFFNAYPLWVSPTLFRCKYQGFKTCLHTWLHPPPHLLLPFCWWKVMGSKCCWRQPSPSSSPIHWHTGSTAAAFPPVELSPSSSSSCHLLFTQRHMEAPWSYLWERLHVQCGMPCGSRCFVCTMWFNWRNRVEKLAWKTAGVREECCLWASKYLGRELFCVILLCRSHWIGN